MHREDKKRFIVFSMILKNYLTEKQILTSINQQFWCQHLSVHEFYSEITIYIYITKTIWLYTINIQAIVSKEFNAQMFLWFKIYMLNCGLGC